MATQKMVAEWFAVSGWPFATSTGSGRSGVDIENLPGLAAEIKATARESVTGALKQAVRNAGGGLPFVVYRPNGQGPTTIADWPVIVPLGVFTTLLAQAGYGSDTGRQQPTSLRCVCGHLPAEHDWTDPGWCRICESCQYVVEATA